MKYKELFLRLRRSPFIRTLSPGQEIRFLNQADKDTGRPPFLHHHEDKNGKGVELLYDQKGRRILEVKLKDGKPYGRAKMYDEYGIQTLPNSYWYYGTELEKSDFYQIEEKEREIRKINQKKTKEKRTSDEKLNKRIDKMYETEGFYARLEILGDLTRAIDSYLEPDFDLILKKKFDNQR